MQNIVKPKVLVLKFKFSFINFGGPIIAPFFELQIQKIRRALKTLKDAKDKQDKCN